MMISFIPWIIISLILQTFSNLGQEIGIEMIVPPYSNSFYTLDDVIDGYVLFFSKE